MGKSFGGAKGMVVEMAASDNVAPIIIKKKKVSGGGGHHGGAWKVAYADFVTAMMAFFMLMWLLNATTEKQRKGIADYFAPTIAISRVSGGGEGSFGGDSVFSENSLAKNGTGATSENPTESEKSRGQEGEEGEVTLEDEKFASLEKMLMGRGGESAVMENELEHIVTRVTDEGLVVELFGLEGIPLFEPGSATPSPLLRRLVDIVVRVSQAVTNPVAVEGHVASEPVVVAQSAIWSLSSARANSVRELMSQQGMPKERLQRVTGYADRELAQPDPMAERNNRIEIILLRTSQN